MKKKSGNRANIGLTRKTEPDDSQPDPDCPDNLEPDPDARSPKIGLRAARPECPPLRETYLQPSFARQMM